MQLPVEHGEVYAFDAGTGALLWVYDTGNIVAADPAVDKGGTIYILTFEGNLYVQGPDNDVTSIRSTRQAQPHARVLVGGDLHTLSNRCA